MGGTSGEREKGGLELSREGREGLSCVGKAVLVGMKKEAPGSKRDQDLGGREGGRGMLPGSSGAGREQTPRDAECESGQELVQHGPADAPLLQRSEGAKCCQAAQKGLVLPSEGVATKRSFFEASAPGRAEPLPGRKVRAGAALSGALCWGRHQL